MTEYICIFIGIAVLFSGRSVGILVDNDIVPIVFYCLGAFLIVIGVRLILNNIAEERKLQEDKILDEIKYFHTNLSAKVVGDDLNCRKEQTKIIYERIDSLGKLYEVQIKAILTAIGKSTYDVNNVLNVNAKELAVKLENIPTQITEPIGKLPEHIVGMLEVSKRDMDDYLDKNKELIEKLIYEIDRRDKHSTSRCEKVISNIENSTLSNNDALKEKIDTLSKQYENFETTIKSIVNQMTEMADKDYDLMKEFLK